MVGKEINYKKIIYQTLLISFALFYTTSCKIKQQAVKPGIISTDSNIELIDKVKANEPKFKTAYISKLNMSVNYNSRQLKNISANCKIIKDTAIYMSIQPVFNIELFSVEITPDSIVVIDKFNRRYFSATYNYIKQKTGIPLNFENLQALFTNSLFSVGEKEINPENCSAEKNKILYNADKIKQETSINGNFEIEGINFKTYDNKYQAFITYEENSVRESSRFPQKITISGIINKIKFNSELKIDKIAFDVPLKLVSSNISNYRRESIEQLLQK